MNLIFAHAATHNLSRFDRPTRLFDPWIGGSYFHRALKAFLESRSLDRLVVVCPGRQESFFRERITESLSKIPGSASTERRVMVHPVPEDDPAAFDAMNSRFHPLLMKTFDHFGAWDGALLDRAASMLSGTRLLVLNLESFWFLSGAFLDALFDECGRGDFRVALNRGEDVIAALAADRLKIRIAQLTKRKKMSLERRMKNLEHLAGEDGRLDAPSIAAERARIVSRRIRTTPAAGEIPEPPRPEISRRFAKDIVASFPAFSLRFDAGHLMASSFRSFLENNSDPKGPALSPPFFGHPWVLRMAFSNASLPDVKQLQLILDKWSFIPHSILEIGIDAACARETIPGIELVRRMLSGRVHVESGMIPPAALEKLYRAGTDVFVMNVESDPEALSDEENAVLFDRRVSSLIEVRDLFPGRLLVLRAAACRPEHPDVLPRLIHRWQDIVDGICVIPDYISGNAYKCAFTADTCTKSPFEIVLFSPDKLSLCTRLPEETFAVSAFESWQQRSRRGGRLEACEGCVVRHRYGSSEPFAHARIDAARLKASIERDSLIERARASIREQDVSAALDAVEKLLGANPADPEARSLLDLVEREAAASGGK